MIVIVDYGMGNLGFIANMLKKLGKDAVISPSGENIMRADKLKLLGVDKFDEAFANLRGHNLIDVLEKEVVDERTSVLGVCLGMRLMVPSRSIGVREVGLFIGLTITRFDFEHMGKSL